MNFCQNNIILIWAHEFHASNGMHSPRLHSQNGCILLSIRSFHSPGEFLGARIARRCRWRRMAGWRGRRRWAPPALFMGSMVTRCSDWWVQMMVSANRESRIAWALIVGWRKGLSPDELNSIELVIELVESELKFTKHLTSTD